MARFCIVFFFLPTHTQKMNRVAPIAHEKMNAKELTSLRKPRKLPNYIFSSCKTTK